MARLIYEGERVKRFNRFQNSAANTAQTLAEPAGVGKTHVVTGFAVIVIAAAAGADITIEVRDGVSGTVVWRDAIGSGAARGVRVAVEFVNPIPLTKGNAAELSVGAGGAAAVTVANLRGYTLEK